MGIDLGPPPETPPSDINVGEVVNYVPHECHAYNCDSNNHYPWVIGIKKPARYEVDPNTGQQELVQDVVELDEGHLHRVVLPAMNRAPNPRKAREDLVPLRPKKPWKAVITKVHPDGSVDLDVDSNVGTGMITLHYSKVKLGDLGTPHTCHRRAN